MKRLNWTIILSNIEEAREALQKIESRIASIKKPDKVELEISLRHAYHHLNTAWNARHAETKKYQCQANSDFKKWGKFPSGFDDLETLG
jgi:hypothetical protein